VNVLLGVRRRYVTPQRPLSWLVGLAAAVVLAVVVRLLNVLVWRPTCLEDMVAKVGEPWDPSMCDANTFAVWGDSAYGYLQARLLADGHGYVDGATWWVSGGETFRQSAGDPPLYPLVLAAFSKLGLISVTSHRLLSALAGVVAVVLIGLIARRVAGHRVGIAAAVIAAVYPMLWINDGMLLSESLFVPLVCAAVLAAYRFWDAPGWLSASLMGLAVGLAAMTRAEALFMLPVLALLVVGLRVEAPWRRVGFVGLAGVVMLAVCAPWIVWNNLRFNEPVFMTSQTGAVLSAASCDATFYGDRLGYWDDCMAWYVETGRVEGWPSLELDESERDAIPRQAAVTYTRENLGRLGVVVPARVARLWDAYRPIEGVEFNAQIEGRGWWPSWAGLVSYYLLVPASIAGGVLLWRRRIPLSPLLAAPFAVSVAAATTFGITRYRAPADAMIVILAAVALGWLMDRWRPPITEATVRARSTPASTDESVPGQGDGAVAGRLGAP
jgi:4-amino-4-deoxy-L-arabinose transferase-like glycosyltransferase